MPQGCGRNEGHVHGRYESRMFVKRFNKKAAHSARRSARPAASAPVATGDTCVSHGLFLYPTGDVDVTSMRAFGVWFDLRFTAIISKPPVCSPR